MKKYRGIILSVSLAAMLMGSCAVFAEDATEAATEAVTEVVTEVAEEAAVDEAAPVEEVSEDGLNASDKMQLEQFAQSAIEMIVNAPEEELKELIAPSSILSRPQDWCVAGAVSWNEVKDALGAYAGVESFDVKVEDDILIDALCNFENGQNKVSLTIDNKTLAPTDMQFETANASLGEKMKEAVLNTLMGVSIVFLMLLFLSLLISQFKNINKIEQAMKDKKAPVPAPAPAVTATPAAAPVEEELVEDGELIAVIAAAIAAAEGTSTDGFVVRSIRKSNRNKWQRA